MDILEKICSDKKDVVERDKSLRSFTLVRQEAEGIGTKSQFQSTLVNKVFNKEIAVIAEIKHKSPSQGILTSDFDVSYIAREYKKGGASCISVLTDNKYFLGKDEYIIEAKNASNLPILRKDFIIDPYQIYQSKIIGADAILLIMSCLSLEEAKEFEEIAYSLGLDVLVETHNEKEIEQALELKTKLIGVNNRNLKTLDISLKNIENLSKFIPDDRIIICESGISSKQDLNKITDLNIYGFLIGGYLMKSGDISGKLAALVEC